VIASPYGDGSIYYTAITNCSYLLQLDHCQILDTSSLSVFFSTRFPLYDLRYDTTRRFPIYDFISTIHDPSLGLT
jgi:hypothetical protein